MVSKGGIRNRVLKASQDKTRPSRKSPVIFECRELLFISGIRFELQRN